MDDLTSLGSEEDQDCKKEADQGPGARGTEGDAEEDGNALGNDAVGYRAGLVIATDDFDEQYGEWCKEDHLKNGVHGDENGAVFVVATSQASPDQDLFQISSTRIPRGQEGIH